MVKKYNFIYIEIYKMASYGQYCSTPVMHNNACPSPVIQNACPVSPYLGCPTNPMVCNPATPIHMNPCPLPSSVVVNPTAPCQNIIPPGVLPCSGGVAPILPPAQFSYAWTPSQVYNYRWCNRPPW
jgi:hypothetical protein